MKQYNSIITSLICMMLISACSGFLEEKSQDEVLVRTVQDYDELLLGYMHNSNGYLMLYALDDDIGINEAKLGTGTTEMALFWIIPDVLPGNPICGNKKIRSTTATNTRMTISRD